MRRKDIKRLEAVLKPLGYTITQGRKHRRIENASGQRVYTIPSSASDSQHWEKNAFAHMKRLGIIPPDARLK